MTYEEAERRWRKAASFSDMCELMAGFLEGTVPFCPTHGELDGETAPLVPYLAAINRAGYLTTCSQPGELHPEWSQRAFVDGLATEAFARGVAARALYSEIVAVVLPPEEADRHPGYAFPVTQHDGRPAGWCGHGGGSDRDSLIEACGRSVAAFAALGGCWTVTVIDPVWGRTGYLWEVLTAPVREGFAAEPAPSLGLEADFYFG